MISNFKRSALFLVTGLFISCSQSSNMEANKGEKIGEVKGKSIYFNEIWEAFNRSNSALKDSITFKNFSNFSDLYLDFRTKLAGSEEAGYFKDSSIVAELNQYETQFAVPFWLEKDIENRLLDEFIERADYELDLSHILIALQPNDPPEDTLKVYKTLIEAREKVLKGANFDSLALAISSTRDNRSMGGPLNWMTAGVAVKPFEDMAYATKVGEMSMPFMTQFGMHVVLVKNKRPRSWDRFISHVFWRSGPEKVKKDSIIELGNRLRNDIVTGKTAWDSVVTKYSQDGLSVKNHGHIGWTSYGRYLPAFNDTMFALNQPGDISKAFYSGYGVHLLRLDSIKTFASEKAKRAELLEKLKTLPRYKNNKEATYKRLREIAKAKRNSTNAERFRKFIRTDSIKAQKMTDVVLPKNIASLELFTMRGKTLKGSDFLTWLKGKYPTQVASDYLYTMFDSFIDETTATFLVEMTKEQFPEYKRTTDEYQNGLVVFKISEDSVWNFVKTDTVNLKKVYENDPSKYWFEKRFHFYRITATKDSLLQAIKKDLALNLPLDTLKNRHKNAYFFDDMISDLTEEPYYLLEKLKVGESTDIFEFKKRKTLLFLAEILEPRQMTFEEAFYRVVSEYQPMREKSWIEGLKTRYKATLNKELLQKNFNDKKAKS